METTPQLNFEYVPPKWNVDKLEGAVLHCLQVCGPLSGAAINAFCQRYAYERNKKLPEDYGTRSLLPRMLRARKAFRISEKLYALNPLVPFDANARLRLDAFWTFLENMEGVDIAGTVPVKDTTTEWISNWPATISQALTGEITAKECMDKLDKALNE